ncbi:probable inactive receptor kinase At5g58300 [Cornus florida]|uniref:probable inactive receptor kinase At5g58300 n=1 Tax=Cornus florida TaxID=4283 RepID=UPI002899A082|nr:probable inactive receptor kinase At5g58300 [Cornus florida]
MAVPGEQEVLLRSHTKQLSMKLLSPFAALTFLLFLVFLPQTIANLKSDKQSLLDFADSIPHGRKLNWNPASPVCTSWVGITCTPNGTRVIALRLPGVGLRGPIPANTLGKLDALTSLSLRSNHLSGSLPLDILSLPSLNYIYLQQNNLSGDIPSSFSPRLNVLDLSFNSFTGNIPISIHNLTHLTGLSLENNSLSGLIPDLKLLRLQHLNLSYNHLNGSIPSSLQKFPISSFQGNSMLCGSPLDRCPSILSPSPSPSPTYLPPSPSPTYLPPSPLPAYLPPSPVVPKKQRAKKKFTGVIIAIAAGVPAVLILLVLMIVLCCFKKKDSRSGGDGGRIKKPKEDFGSGVQEAAKNKLIFFEGCSFNFDLEDLLRASAEVLGKGSYGTTYKAILEEGTTVAVKRLKEVVVGKRDFEQQMEIVGRVGQHPNVSPLRAYFYSKDEKLLVYDYIRLGSLSTQLHGNMVTGRTLDWESRVKISLGTARGVAHIHSAGGGKFTHGNIKSSNVLLAQDLHSCISDFGLTPLMGIPTLPPKTAGYRAPEVIETKKSTQKSDVYSFGVLLLEMLTGKSPVQSLGHDDVVDLPQWVQSVVREEWTAEVFDVELMRYENIEEEMVHMLQIAMACVEVVPDMRPKMNEVVRMIEEIRPSDTGNRPSLEDNKFKRATTHTP